MTLGNIGAAVECRARIESEKNVLLKSEDGESFSVSYKLVRLELKCDLFVLLAECGEEQEGVCLGGDEKRAERIYSLVCREGVMPCVLSETISDLDF